MRKQVGPGCLGSEAAGVKGCGKPRLKEPLLVDERLRWCCKWCAEAAAIKLGIPSPRQQALPL